MSLYYRDHDQVINYEQGGPYHQNLGQKRKGVESPDQATNLAKQRDENRYCRGGEIPVITLTNVHRRVTSRMSSFSFVMMRNWKALSPSF
ncbi:MAG: hypothetical protein QF516_15460 [Pirellulaceae bacterium]|nr:hypothetical protein [Pirellulaceae bacterium]